MNITLPNHFTAIRDSLDLAPVNPNISSLDANKQKIEDLLSAFKVKAEVIGATMGPRLTRYEVRPRLGVRVSAIAKLREDIQCTMSAKSVRMEAPVAGTDFVGIEIPNATPETVVLRDLVDTDDFKNAKSKLTFPLGKGINGEPIFADLAQLPHLLVAGSTNSGKSVFLNALITSILMRSDETEVQFTLIDPKRVELSAFNGIPHLTVPVITNPNDAVNALYHAVLDMDARYQTFEAAGVRNIESYNAKQLAAGGSILPYHVIVIDELADLMMTASNEVEIYLTRLAQLSRAVGIHLVVATQRPSVNIITGSIKANFPARIAFSLPSAIDSRTILSVGGAEELYGRGDMLTSFNGPDGLQRIQGAYLSEDEVASVVLHASA